MSSQTNRRILPVLNQSPVIITQSQLILCPLKHSTRTRFPTRITSSHSSRLLALPRYKASQEPIALNLDCEAVTKRLNLYPEASKSYRNEPAAIFYEILYAVQSNSQAMDHTNAGIGIRACRNDGKGGPVWEFFCWVSSRRWHSGEVPYKCYSEEE